MWQNASAVIVIRIIYFPASYKITCTIRVTICETQTPYIFIKCSNCLRHSWNKPPWGPSWATVCKLWKYWYTHFILCFPCPSLFPFFIPYLLATTNVAKLLLCQEDEETVSSQANYADTANLNLHKWLNSVSYLKCISGSSYPRFLDAESFSSSPSPPRSHNQARLLSPLPSQP